MENTIEISMTDIEFQFDSMEDEYSEYFDADSEVMQDTALIEMKIKAASGVTEENTDTAIKKRTGSFPDQFGGDWDGDFDGGGDS
jgi:hypothetical protein